MTLLSRLASIVRWLFQRNRAEQDLGDELQAFVDMAAADRMRDGAPRADARRLARLHLGGVEQTKERIRTARHGAWIDDVLRDVQYALRTVRRNPGFSAVVIATLSMGIGANTAVFSVVDAVLLRPLTYREPERLVIVHETLPQRGRVPVGAFEFEGWRRAQSFDQMALMAVAQVILTGAGDPERLDAARVSASLFPMLGIEAAVGGTFSADEEIVGRHRTVVLSDGLWRRRFGADPSIVGRAITLIDDLFLVKGILPPRFRFPRLEQLFVMGITGGQPQLWMPFAITDAERGENSFAAVAKLKSGVSAEQARAELNAIMSQLVQQLPNPPRVGAEVISLQGQMTDASRDVIVLVWASIAAVLLIACGNIASLLLARSIARGPELAIRSALGASGRTLLRHSLIDTLTLAALGGGGGVLLAIWLLPVLLRLAPSSMPRLDEVVINQRAVLFAAIATAATGFMVGLLPAQRAARSDLGESLRLASRSGTLNRRDRSARGLTVIVQTALTVACLGAAGLVIQSLVNVLSVEPGFRSDQILTADVSLSPGRYGSLETRAAFTRKALERLQGVPGATSVGFVNKPPLSGISMTSVLLLEGTERAAIPMVERPQGDIRSVDAGYFRTMGIPLLRGELFQETERRSVAVISAATATRAWPGQDPIGKRFRLSARPRSLVEVIGVVGDVRNMGLETGLSTTVYVPNWQVALNGTSFAVRTGTDLTAASAAVRQVITEIDRDAPIDSIRTMRGVVTESVAGRAFQATLLTLFGGIAVALSGMGVFGVMSYAVAQRSKELGIRLALGATPRVLQRMVVGDALRLVSTGIVLGAPIAVGTGFVLRDLLFGVRPLDPRVLLGSSALIVLVAIVAGWLPARRATRIDPVTTLRAD